MNHRSRTGESAELQYNTSKPRRRKSYYPRRILVWQRDVNNMTERDNLTNPQKGKDYAKTMKELADELVALRAEQQTLLVRFALRALKLYQTGTTEPLGSNQMSYLIKYELTNNTQDISAPAFLDEIIKLTKEEWKKQTQQEPKK
jgi:hypothetical protein